MSPCKRFSQRTFTRWLLAILFAVLTTSCSQSADTDAVCDSADRWNSASTGFAEISSDLESTSPGRLREVFSELVSTLSSMSEFAPPRIYVSIAKLAEALKSHIRLHMLFLDNNRITEQGANYLADCLKNK